MLEPKQQVKKKFAVGLILIIISLVLGKIVLIPIIIFPGNETIRQAMIITYGISWLIMIPGIYLTGREGLKLVQKKYKEYEEKTMWKMMEHSQTVKNHGRKLKEHGKKAVSKVKQHSTKLKEQSKQTAQRTKDILKRKKNVPKEEKEEIKPTDETL